MAEPYAALWKSSISRIHLVSGFHLGQIWASHPHNSRVALASSARSLRRAKAGVHRSGCGVPNSGREGQYVRIVRAVALQDPRPLRVRRDASNATCVCQSGPSVSISGLFSTHALLQSVQACLRSGSSISSTAVPIQPATTPASPRMSTTARGAQAGVGYPESLEAMAHRRRRRLEREARARIRAIPEIRLWRLARSRPAPTTAHRRGPPRGVSRSAQSAL